MKSGEGRHESLCIDDTRIRRADCQHCAIRGKMLFSDLDVVAAGQLLEPVTNLSYARGDVIYHQGAEPAALFSLRTGVIKLSMVSPEGDVRIVRLLGPGAVVGLEVQQGLPYHHTAEPLTRVNLCRIPAESLRKIATQQPVLYEGILRQWNGQTEVADAHLLKLSMGIIRDRVLALLNELDDLYRKGGEDLHLPSNKDCADILGTRVESVSRVMAELKRTKILQQIGNGAWQLSREKSAREE